MGFNSESYNQTLYRADSRCPHTVLGHGGFKPRDMSAAEKMKADIKQAVEKGRSVGGVVQGHVMFNSPDSVSFAWEETCASYANETKRWVYEVVPQGMYKLTPDPVSGLWPSLAIIADAADVKSAGDFIGFIPGRGADEVDLGFEVPLDWIKAVRTAESANDDYYGGDRKRFDWVGLSSLPEDLCRECTGA
jgi:hypothetical protein